MRRFDDTRVVQCAFNASHRIAVPRYPWHLARCPDYKMRVERGLPVYKCEWNYLHLFMCKQDWEMHKAVCDSRPGAKKESLALEDVTNVREIDTTLGKRKATKELAELVESPLKIKEEDEENKSPGKQSPRQKQIIESR